MTKTSIFDDMKAIEKEHAEAFERRAKERREKEEIRENIRIKKVAASGGNQFNYAIQEIIKKTILYKGSFWINLIDLGFSETMAGVEDARAFLNLLKNGGCFENFSVGGSNEGFHIKNADKHKLEAYKENLNGTDREVRQKESGIYPHTVEIEIASEQAKKMGSYFVEKDKIKNTQTNTIKNIFIVRGNQTNRDRIVINKNYAESFEVLESTSKNIKSLLNAIIDTTDELKGIEDFYNCKTYLNSNSGCRIYREKNGKQIYAITPIVAFEDNFASNKKLKISKGIKTDVMTFSKYKRLLSQQESRNKD